MEIKSDIEFKGEDWATINQKLTGKFFSTLWEVFKLSVSLGILYDNQLEEAGEVVDTSKAVATIPRTMINRYSEEISYFFKTAILTSRQVKLSEKDRLYLAFSEDVSEEALNFNKINFLKGFANFGATKIANCVSNNETETMESLMKLLIDSHDGTAEELIQMKRIDYLVE